MCCTGNTMVLFIPMRLQQWSGKSTWCLSLHRPFFVLLKNNVPWRLCTQAWQFILLSWMSCVWPTASRQLLPGAQQFQLPVLYCYLGRGVENAQRIDNQNVLGRIASCCHQAGIWTGLKSRHNTICFHKCACPQTVTDTTCACTRTRTHTLLPQLRSQLFDSSQTPLVWA